MFGLVGLDKQGQVWFGELEGTRAPARYSVKWTRMEELAVDDRELGDLPVNEITREMLGGMIRRIREAGRSLGIVEGVRNPLRAYFADLIETKVLPGPNPAADLKHFIGKGAHRKARRQSAVYFTQDEGPVLMDAAAGLCPRWAPFILTGLLAGLRWGESAALRRSDIDWRRGHLTIERTVSDKGHRIEPCKDGDGRRVKASPALLTALRAHVEAMELEGQVKQWSPEQRALVFPTTYGGLLRHPYFLEHVWQPLLVKAGLPYRKYHATRHSRHVALERRRRSPVGPATDGALDDRTDGRHLRARPA